jgi:co-chaperonin GroES (HSP10)
MLSDLRPLRDTLLFQFLDETGGSKGAFSERTSTGLALVRSVSRQTDHRWARVVAVGPDAAGDVAVGDLIYIESLMWTRGTTFDGDKVWKTDISKVLAITNTESLTVPF